mmetsp:Transcript_25587/g.81165  ORF Transcript_25587/g.81165 Transcript_25587/m.81165 type:complete len:288 (+) Transcript_25587:218-1081(+)
MDLGDVPGGAVAFEIAAKFCYDKEDELERADLILLPEVMCLAEYLGMAEGDSSLMARATECLTKHFEEAQSKVAAVDPDSDDDDDDDESAAASEAICAVVEVANKILHDPRIKNAVEQSEEMKKVLRPRTIAPRLATALSPLVSFQPKGAVAGAVTSRVASPRDIQDTPLEGAHVVHGVRFRLIYEVVKEDEGSDDNHHGLFLVVEDPRTVKVWYELRGLSPTGGVVEASIAEPHTFVNNDNNGFREIFTEEHLEKMVDSEGGITVQAIFTILEINGRAVVPGETFA